MSAASPEAFTLSWHKKSADSFARILRRIAAHAQSLAGDSRYSSEEAIHEVRLLIKRVRALLWFARPSLAKTVETDAKTQLRKAAHLLSGHRDVKAAQSTFEKLLEEVDSTRARAAVEKTSQALRERNGAPEENWRETVQKAVKVFCAEVDDFAKAVEHTAKWPSATKRTEKAFRAMRKTGKKARRTLSDPDFHAWRKKRSGCFTCWNCATPIRQAARSACSSALTSSSRPWVTITIAWWPRSKFPSRRNSATWREP